MHHCNDSLQAPNVAGFAPLQPGGAGMKRRLMRERRGRQRRPIPGAARPAIVYVPRASRSPSLRGPELEAPSWSSGDGERCSPPFAADARRPSCSLASRHSPWPRHHSRGLATGLRLVCPMRRARNDTTARVVFAGIGVRLKRTRAARRADERPRCRCRREPHDHIQRAWPLAAASSDLAHRAGGCSRMSAKRGAPMAVPEHACAPRSPRTQVMMTRSALSLSDSAHPTRARLATPSSRPSGMLDHVM
jgi:hypothetical protein